MTADPALQAALLDDPQPPLCGTFWPMSRFHEAPCPAVSRYPARAQSSARPRHARSSGRSRALAAASSANGAASSM